MKKIEKEIVVGMGDLKCCSKDFCLVTYALGSCIGLCVYDEVSRVGGMLHAMLPTCGETSYDVNPNRYVDMGMRLLLQELVHRGAKRERMKAKLVGGAKMFEYNLSQDGNDIGALNVSMVKKKLREAKIPIVREVTGGTVGRTIRFFPASGEIIILTTDQEKIVI